MLELSGAGTADDAGGAAVTRAGAEEDAGCLLSGPALPQEAMDQDDIDKLLGDF